MVPQIIPIRYEPNYVTNQIGTYADGNQFMAFVTAAVPMPLPQDWRRQKRWYSVLHRFDASGNHVKTDAWFAGTTADGERQVIERARERLSVLLGSLDGIRFRDVKVRLFNVDIDGHTFGLVDASESEEDYERIDLLPNNLAFFPPWDGSYDT